MRKLVEEKPGHMVNSIGKPVDGTSSVKLVHLTASLQMSLVTHYGKHRLGFSWGREYMIPWGL